LQIKRVMNSTQLLDRDDEWVGVHRSRGMGRPGDEPDRYAGKNGRKKRREQNRLWPEHRINRLEVSEILEAGPAIFTVNQSKYDVHEIKSGVDYATKIAVLCFNAISSGDEFDFARRENDFQKWLTDLAGRTVPEFPAYSARFQPGFQAA